VNVALLLALASLAGPASTPTGGERPKVFADAAQVQYAFPKGEVIMTGTPATPVRLRREDATLTCHRLVATKDDQGQISHAVCTGDVKLVRGLKTVTCERATFENAAATVVCEGSPVLYDGPSEAHGTRLVYDLKSDKVSLQDAKITMPGDSVDQQQKQFEQRRKEGRK
jgi:lipopolysaccharide export system protein LptA